MSLLPAPQEQRWHLPAPLAPGALQAAPASDPLPEPLLALLSRRGFTSPEAIAALLDPEAAPAAGRHFPDLAKAVARLKRACSQREAVAICGDYDADGMTSTALLVGVLQRLGARPIAAIPSRMDDGYGLNAAMVEKLAEQGVALLVTVDNGVSALEALERAKALGVEAILTDHHTIPDPLPPHLALLHPQRTPPGSPYRGLAGVGLAYVLAAALCQSLRHTDGQQIALNLFCIGTIADMAPLVGVNRRWLIDGLPELGRSPLVGLQALQQLAGLDETPIEAEALALLEADGPQRPAFLLLAQNHWHHGVIGIVAARLVERFGLPAALLDGEGNGRLRASVRAPRGFAVDGALQQCAPLLERFGGHPAAGGFTVRAEQVAALHEQLNQLAQTWLQQAGHGTPVEPEALLSFEQINRSFYRQLQRLEPFGIGHPQPVFWSQGCQVATQKLLRGGHLQLELRQGEASLRAMGWRWQGETNLPALLDVAYRLRLDSWQGEERLQLELVGLRASAGGAVDGGEVVLQHHNRTYWCRREGAGLVVRNAAGDELTSAEGASHDHPYVRGLMQDAALALGLVA